VGITFESAIALGCNEAATGISVLSALPALKPSKDCRRNSHAKKPSVAHQEDTNCRHPMKSNVQSKKKEVESDEEST
jgi:hypothetical protein